ncbi:MAG: hypothetical protein PHF11_01105 [Candidatus Omnitrophica bacterium]|nr:hypothetical protein [Candidatus Omnitrophota bacterium]
MVKKLFLSGIALWLAASFAFAQVEMTITGTIIDNQCTPIRTPEKLKDFLKTYTKEKALMSTCAASGYSIYTSDGRIFRFDKDSNFKILVFLEKKDSKLDVTVSVDMVGNELSLVSIANKK